MLPSQLLRVRTRKGEIIPLFCTGDDKVEHLQLAKTAVGEFEESAAKKEKKGLLDRRISTLENLYDDYRLVRGLSTLLERRCQFKPVITPDSSNSGGREITPVHVRKLLWEESSRRGFALTQSQHDDIVRAVAIKMEISQSQIKQLMWSDLEENMILDRFDSIGYEELIGWYNLSLMQTLLFNCTKLEFSVYGGVNWKHILRNVKRLGLMYDLQMRFRGDERADEADEVDNEDKTRLDLVHTNLKADNHKTEIICSIDGAASLFKLTERYGASIAKLLPSIIASPRWSLNAWIVRKTMSGKKIYSFKISWSEAQLYVLGDPFRSRDGGSKSTTEYFDSSVEEKFANRFEQIANKWELKREPDPLVVTSGSAFIPDFVFEKYGKKVYLEIVGFWTKEYLERKYQKIIDVFSNKDVDLFVAVNEELSCSKIMNQFNSVISQDKIIIYKKNSVPVKKINDYLKSIDKEQIETNVVDSKLRIKFDGAKDVISIQEIADGYNVPTEVAIIVASRDNDRDYLKAESWFISRSRVNKLAKLLAGTTKFTDACVILSENSIPEPCHAELISKLGYDVIWQSMDSGDAVIIRRN
jgi:predicted nuclease of restriction endonuclease-like RecB superfamily